MEALKVDVAFRIPTIRVPLRRRLHRQRLNSPAVTLIIETPIVVFLRSDSSETKTAGAFVYTHIPDQNLFSPFLVYHQVDDRN
jgi:hypothetical protein